MDLFHFLRQIFEPCDYFIDLLGVGLSLFRHNLVFELVYLGLNLSNIFAEITHLLFQFVFNLDSLVSQVLFSVLDEKHNPIDCRKCLDNRLIIFFV